MNVLAKTKGISYDDWLSERMKGIGGSDASIILGLNKWKSPFQLWMEKTGQVEAEPAGLAARLGRELEQLVAKMFEEETGLKVRRRNAILVNSQNPFMIANIDRLIVGERVGLECKTTSAFKSGDWKNGEIPFEYYCQCQHYMEVTGFKKWWIAVLIGNQQFTYKLLERDEPFIQGLIAAERKFWDCVQTMTPPDPDGSAACGEFLDKRFADCMPGSIMNLPVEASEILNQYEKAKDAEKAAKEQKEAAENRIKLLLGETESALSPDGRRIFWKSIVSNRFDSKTFQKEHDQLYRDYCKSSSYRKFELK